MIAQVSTEAVTQLSDVYRDLGIKTLPLKQIIEQVNHANYTSTISREIFDGPKQQWLHNFGLLLKFKFDI